MAMTFGEKVAHLTGLLEGLDIDTSEPNGRALAAIADVLKEAATTVKDMEKRIVSLTEQIDAIDEDLDGLESYVYEELSGEDWDEDDELEDFEVEVQCPACQETFTVDNEIVQDGSINCPACSELLEFEVSFDVEEDETDDKE
ncbi:MAG: hypothetical protein FWG82_05220 [Oscillospiraceae bacterium]|nr:hypothetical protein [Oscillospiraceae bacterium]